MAQTHTQNTTHDAPLPNGASPDQTAWLAECAAIKCRTDAGEVWAYSGGKLFTVPAPAGFAELPAASRRLFAMMAMQFLPTRVGQNASGNVSDEIAKAVADPSAYFSTKDKDAFEAAYGDHVSDLVDNVKGWNADAIKKMSDADKKARAALIAASIDKPSNRDKFFESSVRAAIEAGKNVTGKEKKRQAKSTGDGGLDL